MPSGCLVRVGHTIVNKVVRMEMTDALAIVTIGRAARVDAPGNTFHMENARNTVAHDCCSILCVPSPYSAGSKRLCPLANKGRR